jgi:hypothetical protein
MQNISLAQWYTSDNVCCLCDLERHLAHIVRIRDQWFAFDAIHPDGKGIGFVFLGSYARRQTAMEAAESETIQPVIQVSFAAA